MKKKLLYLVVAGMLSISLMACGKEEEVVEEPVIPAADTTELLDGLNVVQEEAVVEAEPEPEFMDGCYRSELTNEWTPQELMDQRPVAIMVDNEVYALQHYGTSTADIVYEMMNSTQNGRITRFMCVVKDWKNIERFGSIRSTRTTNCQIVPEYNAILIHDGGPFYIDAFMKNPYMNHISGGFERFNNGKATEFTEYVTNNGSVGLANRIVANGFSETYNQYYQYSGQQHFQFTSGSNPNDLSAYGDATACNKIELPFPHNSSQLEYIPETGLYRYSEYGKEYIDALNNNHLEFKNLIIQECTFEQYDDHGYMNYFVTRGGGMHGYYITNGKAIPITWDKPNELSRTVFKDANGNEITLNTGKTYIAIVPSDVWSDLKIQ